MDTLLTILLVAAIILLALMLVAWLVWWRLSASARSLMQRIGGLPLRDKLALARALAQDERVPVSLRLVLPALVLYLALPIDIVPDFIPVLGQIDDVVVAAVSLGLVLRFMPRAVLEEHLRAFEHPL